MRYLYRIFHSEAGVSPFAGVQPLTAEAQLREYTLLPSYLDQCAHGTAIAVSCTPAASAADGIVLTLESASSEDHVTGQLSEWLVRINQQIRGLCLIATRLPSP